MTGKLFVVLFAFLTVQGWTSAGTIPDNFEDFLETGVDLLQLNVLEDIPWKHFTEVEKNENKSVTDCVPYVPAAYSAAKEAQKLIGQVKEFNKRMFAAAKKCKALSNPDKRKKCFQELKKQAEAEGKPLLEAYKQLKPKISQSMADFDKCMT